MILQVSSRGCPFVDLLTFWGVLTTRNDSPRRDECFDTGGPWVYHYHVNLSKLCDRPYLCGTRSVTKITDSV